MNFNSSPEIFRQAQTHYRDKNIELVVTDGFVVAGAEGVVARFSSQESAIATLECAGYQGKTVDGKGFYYPPQTPGYLQCKYGGDFLKKLLLYKTARLDGQWVKIESVDTDKLLARVRLEGKRERMVGVASLDDFCL